MDPLISSAVNPPTGTYRGDPPGQLTCCPRCGVVLDHFINNPGQQPPPASWTPSAQLSDPPKPIQEPIEGAPEIDPADVFGTPIGPAAPPPEPAPPVLQFRSEAKPDAKPDAKWRPLQSNRIGGRFTIMVALSGTEDRLHRRVLTDVLRTVPAEFRDLRILCQGLGQASRELVASAGPTAAYRGELHNRALLLGQVMNDTEHPIETKYAVWLSDDAVLRNDLWLIRLAETISRQPVESRVALYGSKRRTVLQSDNIERTVGWFRSASWYRGRPFRNRLGNESPNGNEIHYVTSHFWAVDVEAARDCGVPDRRLVDGGLSVCLGEQLYQGGWNMKMFDNDGRLVGVNPGRPGARQPRAPWYGG